MIGLIRTIILRKRKPLKNYVVWLDGKPWQGAYYANMGRAKLYANAIVKERSKGEVLREWSVRAKGILV